LWLGRRDTEQPLAGLRTNSGKIEICIEEMAEQVATLTPAHERSALRRQTEFPFILFAGRHMQYNANTLMRNPEWNENKRACTIAMHPADADALGFADGQEVRVTTEAGSATGDLEITAEVRPGTILIPHGFGLVYEGQVYGLNVNRLTRSSNRDSFGTPLHRYVPCRIEPV